MSWLNMDLGRGLEDFGALVPETTWQLDEFPESLPKKRRVDLVSIKKVVEKGAGTILVRIAGMDNPVRAKPVLYVKDKRDLIACLVPSPCGAKIGDLVSIDIVDVRNLEAASQVNQTICSIPKVLFGSEIVVRTLELDRVKDIVRFPWELSEPMFVPLNGERKSEFSRLKLTVIKLSKSEKDQTLHLLCHDSEGTNATIRM
jgi:hypothetical protein